MRRWPALAFMVLVLSAPPARADPAGFATIAVPDPPGENLKVGVWYPTRATPSDQDIGLFTQSVAPNAVVAPGRHPLVVVSHGTGGTLEEHYDTALALARAGFVVAAMMHTGDNYLDQSHATKLPERPRAVHAVIDFMLSAWPEHRAIDPAWIGAFGFSSGGFTMLVAAGGIPDLSRIGPYCGGHADTFVCQLVKAHPETSAAPPIRADAWIADPRIKAAVIAAPAIGFTFTQAGLARVRIPIQLWRAQDDHILPAPDYADAVRAALPRPPEFHDVPGADHFDFLAPCSEALARTVPAICQEHGGFDRAAFHRAFDRDVVRFFQRTLGP
jgi:predicted dienelactone hydrolase